MYLYINCELCISLKCITVNDWHSNCNLCVSSLIYLFGPIYLIYLMHHKRCEWCKLLWQIIYLTYALCFNVCYQNINDLKSFVCNSSMVSILNIIASFFLYFNKPSGLKRVRIICENRTGGDLLHASFPPSRTYMARSSAPTRKHRSSLTFQAANPPEAGVGEGSGILLVLVMRVILRGVGSAVADKGPSVQPVVRANGHGHQGEGCECSHSGEKHLNSPLTPHHGWKRAEVKEINGSYNKLTKNVHFFLTWLDAFKLLKIKKI